MDLKRGVDLAVEAIVADLQKNTKKVTSNEEIAQVGTISANGDTEIGNFLAKAMQKVGNEGVITVEEAKSLETELDVVEGMRPIQKGDRAPAGQIVGTSSAAGGESSHCGSIRHTRVIRMHIPIARCLSQIAAMQFISRLDPYARLGCITFYIQAAGLFTARNLNELPEARLRNGGHRCCLLFLLRLCGDWSCMAPL